MPIKWIGAHPNNYQVGRAGKTPKYVVLHWIVGSLESADSTFQSPTRLASAHYGIGDGDVHQYVKETDTAYANSNLISNRESVTIEHEGGWLLPDKVNRFKPTDKTHETSAQLVKEICTRYSIPLDRAHIIGHREVQGANTQCPGTLDIDKIIALAKGPTPPQGGGETMVLITDVIKASWRAITGSEASEFDVKTEEAKKPFNLEALIKRLIAASAFHTDAEFKELQIKLTETEKKLQEALDELSKPPTPTPLPPNGDDPSDPNSATNFYARLFEFIRKFFTGR